MIVLQQVSGIVTPPAGKSHIYAYTNGYFATKDSNGFTALPLTPSLTSGLRDVSGTFTNGMAPHWNGTAFVPTAMIAPDTQISYSTSGNTALIPIVLASGQIPNGTSGYIAWSGFSTVAMDRFEIVGEVRGRSGFGIAQLEVYFNADFTATNYQYRRALSVAGQNLTGDTAYCGPIVGGDIGGADNIRAVTHLVIPIPGNNSIKWIYSAGWMTYNNGGAAVRLENFCTQWESTAAITQIHVFNTTSAAMTSGTYLYLIGYKQVAVNGSGIFGSAKIAHGMIIP